MLTEDKADNDAFSVAPQEEQQILKLSRGPEIRCIDENKHVNDDEFLI